MRLLELFTFCLFFTAQVIHAQGPCETEAHSEFDFWVGEWKVFHATADTLVGHNTITRTLNGCVVEEHWKGQTGFEGKSFNTFNPTDKSWNQVWVDVAGNTYHFKGAYSKDVMQMYGKSKDSEGNAVDFDMSYHFDSDKKTVRQIWKMSKDDGHSWQTIFDGIYRKE